MEFKPKALTAAIGLIIAGGANAAINSDGETIDDTFQPYILRVSLTLFAQLEY